MVIIGIDPGLAHTGWGVIQPQGNGWRACAYGCIDTSPKRSMAQRLHHIYEGIAQPIEHYQVTHGAIEEVFFGTNAKSAVLLGQARGVALLACAQCSEGIGEYSANSIKQCIVGHGHADKDQIAYMVKTLLNLDHLPKPDHCSDALAIALTLGLTFCPYPQKEGSF